MPLPATLFAPEFIRFDQAELKLMLNSLRDPLTVHLYFLIVCQSDFRTGELNTSYDRLIDLCTPARPERGRRLDSPSKDQVRRAIKWLIDANLVRRNAAKNVAQGTLRLHVYAREKALRKKPKNTG